MSAGILGVFVLAVLWRIVTQHRCRRKKTQSRAERQQREKETASRREAHYMRNFWSYDGSSQEEFEE